MFEKIIFPGSCFIMGFFVGDLLSVMHPEESLPFGMSFIAAVTDYITEL